MRQFVRQGAANTKFSFESAKFLFPKPEQPYEGEIHIIYRLYMQTRRRVDDLNLYAALDDILVAERIVKDDSIKYIRSRDGSRVSYDKEHPRAEIYIYDYREEEDSWLNNQQPVLRCSQ